MQSCSTIKITHLKQIHNIDGIRYLSPMDYEKIANSQFHVAQAILADQKENKSLVLVEGLTQDLSSLEMSIVKSEEAHYLFPHGLPHRFSELNAQQKYFLVVTGGAYTLYYLNQLPNLYKTITPEDAKEIRAELDYENPDKMINKIYYPGSLKLVDRFDKIINERREMAALKLAEKTALSTKNPNILLVYGAAHDFTKQIRSFSVPVIFTSLTTFDPVVEGFQYKRKLIKDNINLSLFKKNHISAEDIALLLGGIVCCLSDNMNEQSKIFKR